nr:hypothetical protein B0A51_03148 [Rachicladosporium sp. CCFEE 5018]
MALKLRERFRRLLRRSSAANEIKKKNPERRGTVTTPNHITPWLSEQRAESEVHELPGDAVVERAKLAQRMNLISEESSRPASAPAAQASLESTISRALSPARSVQLPSGAWAADVLTTLRLDPESKHSTLEPALQQVRHEAITVHDEYPSLAAPSTSGVAVDPMLHPADCVELESTAVVQSSVTDSNDKFTCNASNSHTGLPSKERKPRPTSVNLLLPGSWPED